MSAALEVLNLDAFDRSVQGWFAAVEKAAAEAAVGLAKTTLNHILRSSPQYSGDFVANWNVSINHADSSFIENAVGGRKLDGKRRVPVYQRGDAAAIDHATARAAGTFAGFKLGNTIYLSNSAKHDEPYAWKIENGTIKFRPVNAGADHVVRRGAEYAANRFTKIGPSQFAYLRRFGA